MTRNVARSLSATAELLVCHCSCTISMPPAFWCQWLGMWKGIHCDGSKALFGDLSGNLWWTWKMTANWMRMCNCRLFWGFRAQRFYLETS